MSNQQLEIMRFIRSQWLVAALALLIVVVPCGCHHRQQEQSSSNTPSSDDGLPRTLAELDAWYVEPPAGQNAATLFSRGLNAVQIGKAGSSDLPLLGKGK